MKKIKKDLIRRENSEPINENIRRILVSSPTAHSSNNMQISPTAHSSNNMQISPTKNYFRDSNLELTQEELEKILAVS